MLEEIASSWMIGLYSFLEISQFTPKVPNLWDKESFNVQPINGTRIKRSDVLLGYLIMFWVVLYFMYEKCLNSLLRRMRIPLMQRNRIIKAVWECGFCFGSICYLKSPTIKTLSFFTGEQEVTHEELGVILHKSFYFHRAGIEILCHGAWIKGWVNLLFVSFIMNPYQEKWCTVVSTFLFYKAIDTIIINICRILLCGSHNAGRKLSKLFFYFHCLSWLVWFRFLGCAKATHWLEICLFPSPTREAIELAGIQKRHRESLKKLVNKTSKRAELWQTLFCKYSNEIFMH
ncbi:unnamed protein product [Heterotrigona itama]|uniref:TLC domain-containing protein n=1 Tax=Heterotrigona itama TaxID=395501 RepID=A0A6V7H0H4_9HYME|nr:unnamed protein product [Heterotrigona itama]